MRFAVQRYRTCCLAILTMLLLAISAGAYIVGYPLVTMDMTRRVITNVAAPEGTRAPMGQLIKMRQYPNAAFRDVTAPNADTLYTTAFFDVGKEPGFSACRTWRAGSI